uniref:G_PROTEIN_RECEP_F1_2 domain-containing protein n=1 Tax=Elaeophora elaphi TaxID=1147741 RepID=A0A0R3RFZ4_9BILA
MDEDNIAMACITVVWIFGLVSNSLSLYITRTSSYFRNAFGILCSSFLVCNLQSISVLFTWCAIVLATKLPILSTPELFITRLIGVLVNGTYYGSLFSHFFIALNRFCAVAYPIRYRQLWSQSRALIAGIISYTLGTTFCMIHLYKDCSLLFNQSSNYCFFYGDSFHGNMCRSADAIGSVSLIASMACIDFITLIKILAYRRKSQRNTTTSTSDTINEREIIFFKQSCLISFIYITVTTVNMTHPLLFANKWLLFLSSTISWMLLQSVEGCVLLIFNRKVIWKSGLRRAVTTAPATTIFRLQIFSKS